MGADFWIETMIEKTPAKQIKELEPTDEASITEDQALSASLAFQKIKITYQAWILFALSLVLMAVLPFTQTIYYYYAIHPERETVQLTGLDMPNMTNQAILSWATISISEVLTMGFGDIDMRLIKQRNRFTKSGWDDFLKTIRTLEIRDRFKKSQLVLTAVPRNIPTILAQGLDENKVYKWGVKMPIVMTYATNNNVTQRQFSEVFLLITRVPTHENHMGIAIDKWQQF